MPFEIRGRVRLSKARTAFEGLVSSIGADTNLGEIAAIIAAEDDPAADVSLMIAELDELGVKADARIKGTTGAGRARAMADYLGQELGFRGNVDDYYDPKNSYLNYVLEARTGIPITLSLVYLEVGRRASVPLSGVGLPGHFLVRSDEEPELFLDPFARGRALTRRDLPVLIERAIGRRMQIGAAELEPPSDKAIVARMLANLKTMHRQRGDYLRAASACERILLLDPGHVGEILELGRLYLAAGLGPEAEEALKAYAEVHGPTPETAALLGRARGLDRRTDQN
ncbi:MAG: transglutaminase-like domain-containing protein [Myxococcota bacterium]